MVGGTLFGYGMGVAFDFASDDRNNISAWYVVCFGWWAFLFNRCNILFVAPIKIRACVMAFVRYRWVGVFLFRSPFWFNYRFCEKLCITRKPPYRRFFNQMDFRLFCIQLRLASVPNVMPSQFHDAGIVYKILGYHLPHQH